MSFWQVLFSFRGRIGRGSFWAGSGVATVLAAVGVVTGLAAFGAGFTTGSTAGLGVAALVVVVTMLAFLWMTYALLVKRMRDRGKSAWWLLPFFVPLALRIGAWLEGGIAGMAALGMDPKLAALEVALGLWLFVEFGFMKGVENGEDGRTFSPLARGLDDGSAGSDWAGRAISAIAERREHPETALHEASPSPKKGKHQSGLRQQPAGFGRRRGLPA